MCPLRPEFAHRDRRTEAGTKRSSGLRDDSRSWALRVSIRNLTDSVSDGLYQLRPIVPNITHIPANRPCLHCVFRSMWAPDSIRCGHLILFDVCGNSVLMWAAFFVLP